VGKRLVKSPKLYFIDPAICTYLLGLDEARVLYKNPSFGSLFETMIVGDFLKRYLHGGERPLMYYLRSRDGLEIDLVIEQAGKLFLFEIKSTMTITSRHAASLVKLRNDPNVRKSVAGAAIISAAESNFMVTKDIPNCTWQSVLIK
jgi:predicted AAA+ superfamily ATPase